MPWMRAGAMAGWLIPGEFMDVNYGRELKAYLLRQVTLLRIHRFDPAALQFSDALVSSAMVWLRNEPPPRHMRWNSLTVVRLAPGDAGAGSALPPGVHGQMERPSCTPSGDDRRRRSVRLGEIFACSAVLPPARTGSSS